MSTTSPSINKTINDLRLKEVMDAIPTLTTNELIQKRADLKQALFSSTAESMSTLDRNSIPEVTMAISRELTQRAEQVQKEAGIDPASNTARVIQQAKEARKRLEAQRLHDNLYKEQQYFDSLSPAERAEYLVTHEKPNPYSLTPEEFAEQNK